MQIEGVFVIIQMFFNPITMQQFKDETPQEQGEGFDRSSAQAAETGDEGQRAEQEFAKAAPELEKLDAAEMATVLKALYNALEKGDEQKILQLMWQLDQSEFMIKLRNWWNRRSSFLQKYLNEHPLFKGLVTFGFLEIKGVSRENMDKAADTEAKLTLPLKRAGVRVAAIFVPELRPFVPLVEVVTKLQERTGKLGKLSRKYLAERRETEDKKEKAKYHKGPEGHKA